VQQKARKAALEAGRPSTSTGALLPLPLPLLVGLVTFDLPPDRWHDEGHMWSVAATGLDLAAETPAADAEIAVPFGVLHDARLQPRPGHGHRAAGLARELQRPGLIELAPERLDDGPTHVLNG